MLIYAKISHLYFVNWWVHFGKLKAENLLCFKIFRVFTSCRVHWIFLEIFDQTEKKFLIFPMIYFNAIELFSIDKIGRIFYLKQKIRVHHHEMKFFAFSLLINELLAVKVESKKEEANFHLIYFFIILTISSLLV